MTEQLGHRPRDIAEYRSWLKRVHSVEVSTKMKNYYEMVASKVQADFKKSSFWTQLKSQYEQLNQEYYLKTNYYLFHEADIPEFNCKSFNSFLFKTFRKNVLDNPQWPEPPGTGWVLPDTWFTQINDMVRTCFVVKYLDGVNTLAEKCTILSEQSGYTCNVDYEARDEGYYAAHINLLFPCDVPSESWDSKLLTIPIELQITTQLQEVIRRLLHVYYEKRRADPHPAKTKWQWDYKSGDFSANYLGHILHYIEGMIMEVRERSRKETQDEG